MDPQRHSVSVYPKGNSDDIFGIKMRLLFPLNRIVPVAIVSTSFRQEKYIKAGSWLKQLPTSRDRVILRKSRTLFLVAILQKQRGSLCLHPNPCTDLTMMEHAKQKPFSRIQKMDDEGVVLAMAWISAFQTKPNESLEESHILSSLFLTKYIFLFLENIKI